MPRTATRARPLPRVSNRGTEGAPGLHLTRLSPGLVLVRVGPPDDAPHACDPFAGTALTLAERTVVHLVLGGLSNAEVAKVRGASPRTIANQLTVAYVKLGVSGRRDLLARFRPRPGRRAPTHSR